MSSITIVLPKLTPGGTERTAVELANYLISQKIKVTVVLMYKRELFFNLNNDVKLIEPKWNPQTFIGQKIYWGYLLIYLNVTIRRSRPDVILLLGYILIGLIASLGLHSKIFFSNRTNPTRPRFPNNNFYNRVYNSMYRVLKTQIHGIVAQTETAKIFYSKIFDCPIKIIPNSLKNMNYFPNQKKEENVITIGRAVPEKGQKYFIDLVYLLKQTGSNLKFILIGDGPELIDLKQYAVKLELIDDIAFLGFRENVDYYLSSSKYFILTSLTEGYPNVLIEAMAHGCVPFSFNCVAGPSDIIEHEKNGYLSEVGDVMALCGYIEKIVQNPEIFSRVSDKAQNIRATNNSELLNREWMKFLFD